MDQAERIDLEVVRRLSEREGQEGCFREFLRPIER